MYVINLPLFFQTKQQNHVSFPSLSSVREEEEEVVFKRNRRRLSEKSRKSDWKGTDRSHQKGYPSISHYTRSFYRKTRSSNRGKPHPIFSIVFLLYPPISYIIAESRDRQFHVGWNVTSLLTLTI